MTKSFEDNRVNLVNDYSKKLLTEEELAALGKERQKTFIGSLFPVLRIELSRFILMACAFFTIAFIYTFLRVYKDNIIYSKLEPAAQSYLKVMTAPVTFIFIGIVNKLLTRYNIDKTFEIGTIGFVIVLLLMAVLIKIRDYIQPNPLWALNIFIMETAAARGFRPLFVLSLIVNQWVLSLLYILSDVIGSIMVGYFFMTYVNAHCTQDQNKRFVRILYIFSNVAGYMAGAVMERWSKNSRNMDRTTVDGFYFLFTLMSAGCFFLVLVFKNILDHIFKTNPIVIPSEKPKKKTLKKKSGFADGLYLAWTSKLLWALSIMTLSYNICNTLVSSLFTNANKATVAAIPNLGSFGTTQKSRETSYTAFATIIVLLTPVSRLFEWFGVISSGGLPVLITFIGTVATCIMACINYPACGEENMAGFKWLGEFKKRHEAESFIALATVSAVKVSKYAFFDIVKEAIAMKINPADRALYKSVFDGICGKLGKLFGSFYHIIMENITGGVLDARYFAPVTLILTFLLCLLWCKQVLYLHQLYKKSINNNEPYFPQDNIKQYNIKG